MFVSLARYNALKTDHQRQQDRVDSLLGENERLLSLVNGAFDKVFEQSKMIAELRRDGFQAKAAPVVRNRGEVPGTPDLAEVAREGAKTEFIERFSSDLQKTGIPKATADMEAKRVAATMYDQYGGDE